ncbi:MAG: phosphomethylpyrimidine synthase ThiC [Dethiobacter sp.]|nr:MAG: phosphomethylpyrimidine synthase ThiC [Dethiobacter sp.]
MRKDVTQVSRARQGEVTPQVKLVASQENLPVEVVMNGVAGGTIVIPANINRQNLQPRGIGQGLRIKINANIGTSEAFPEKENEKAKLFAALQAGADAVMDLSTGGDLKGIRSMVLDLCPVPVGTVPIYEAAVKARLSYGGVLKMKEEDLFTVIEEHAAEGVDFMTLHCGLTMSALDCLRSEGRIMGLVSRGGAILAGWMLEKERENPLYENFDRLLEIAGRYDVTLSLGDGMRPGCLEDATDRAQLQELLTLGQLVQRAREAEVQVMVEGPGHVPFDQIETNMKAAKSICKGAPFYVLGPLVTDVTPGYDHISAAIGGTMAAVAGADFLCYVTPTEHLGLPGPEEVHQGVMASRIAAHAADVVKGVKGAREWDREMSLARRRLDWGRQLELSLDPALAKSLYKRLNPQEKEECTMCGSYCALKMVKEYLA